MNLRALAACVGLVCLPAAEAAPAAKRRPPRTLTFFVASDTHFGVPGIEERNRRLIDELNGLPGVEYPAEIGGRVEAPRGVLITGDLTDYSEEEQWRAFERFYGLTGKEGLLRFPVKETWGNHDFMGDSPVLPHIVRRHGGTAYSFDWDDVHFASLGMYPSAERLRWLEDDLRKVAPGRLVVLFFHYGIDGPWSQSWESPEEREELARLLAGRRVAAIFHGHAHQAGSYRWRDYDVFRPGSPKHSSHEVMAVRIRGDEVAVAYRDFDTSSWTRAFVRTVPAEGPRTMEAGPAQLPSRSTPRPPGR